MADLCHVYATSRSASRCEIVNYKASQRVRDNTVSWGARPNTGVRTSAHANVFGSPMARVASAATDATQYAVVALESIRGPRIPEASPVPRDVRRVRNLPFSYTYQDKKE